MLCKRWNCAMLAWSLITDSADKSLASGSYRNRSINHGVLTTAASKWRQYVL